MTTTDTDEDLRRLARRLFTGDERSPDEIERDRLANPEPKPAGNVVPAEGDNPAPARGGTYEDHLRQLALELFNPHKAATDPAV